MADERGKRKPRYYRAVWGRAWADWKASVRARLIWGLVVAVAAFVVWSFVTSTQQALTGAIVTVSSVALAAFLYLIWHRLWAPARMWTDIRQTIADLTSTRERLEADAAQRAQQLTERDGEITRLTEVNAALDGERQACFQGDLGQQTTEEKVRTITLCATATGLGTTCCSLNEEFFAPRKNDSKP